MKRCGKSCAGSNQVLKKEIDQLRYRVCMLEKMLTRRLSRVEKQVGEASSVIKCMGTDSAYSDCWNTNYKKFVDSGCNDPLFAFFKSI